MKKTVIILAVVFILLLTTNLIIGVISAMQQNTIIGYLNKCEDLYNKNKEQIPDGIREEIDRRIVRLGEICINNK